MFSIIFFCNLNSLFDLYYWRLETFLYYQNQRYKQQLITNFLRIFFFFLVSQTNMKIQAEVILNLKRDGATSTLLILDEEVYILLDCGLNANLDFSAYHNKLELLSKVEIILLSHVGSEYVGALPFLLNARQITGSSNKPIKIYSTTPVMKLGLFNAYNQYLNA